MYKIHQKNPDYIYCIERLSDHAMIPLNPDNTDYQEYLRWLEAGNTPVEASTEVSVPAEENQ